MKTYWHFLLAFLVAILGEACSSPRIDVADNQMNQYVSDLMDRMTLREKLVS